MAHTAAQIRRAGSASVDDEFPSFHQMPSTKVRLWVSSARLVPFESATVPFSVVRHLATHPISSRELVSRKKRHRRPLWPFDTDFLLVPRDCLVLHCSCTHEVALWPCSTLGSSSESSWNMEMPLVVLPKRLNRVQGHTLIISPSASNALAYALLDRRSVHCRTVGISLLS